jgi:hypothetical protein
MLARMQAVEIGHAINAKQHRFTVDHKRARTIAQSGLDDQRSKGGQWRISLLENGYRGSWSTKAFRNKYVPPTVRTVAMIIPKTNSAISRLMNTTYPSPFV